MIDAQGGDVSVFDNPAHFHKPGATSSQRLGIRLHRRHGHHPDRLGRSAHRRGPRESRRSPSIPTRGILFHARRGARLEKGQPIATLYATLTTCSPSRSPFSSHAITISATPLPAVPLVGRIFTRENAEAHLRDAVR